MGLKFGPAEAVVGGGGWGGSAEADSAGMVKSGAAPGSSNAGGSSVGAVRTGGLVAPAEGNVRAGDLSGDAAGRPATRHTRSAAPMTTSAPSPATPNRAIVENEGPVRPPRAPIDRDRTCPDSLRSCGRSGGQFRSGTPPATCDP